MNRVPLGFRVRLKPTKREEVQMLETVKACIWAWNWAIGINRLLTENSIDRLNSYEMRQLFGVYHLGLKKFDWLEYRHVPIKAINETFHALEKAYKSCYRVVVDKNKKPILDANGKKQYELYKHPNFKSTKLILNSTHFGYPDGSHRVYFKDSKHVCLSKLTNMQYCSWTYPNVQLPTGTSSASQIKNPHVIFDHGFWYLCFVMYVDIQQPQLNDFSVGVDVGLKQLATISYTITDPVTGVKQQLSKMYDNINKTDRIKRKEKRKRHLQRKRSHARRKNGNRNNTCGVKKLTKSIKTITFRQTNIRNDYNHKVSREIVNMHPKRIVCEDLNIQGMLRCKNKHRAYQISCTKWYMLLHCLEYKGQNEGIEIIFANQRFPSSKTCSRCGKKKKKLKLSERKYVCQHCGLVIDRDVNAARNLEQYVEPKSKAPKKPSKSFHKKTQSKKKKIAISALMTVLQLRINGLHT